MPNPAPSAFQNKVVVVIGGASGIGEALCRLLAQDHATVVVADLNLARAQELARNLGSPATAFEVNIAAPESIQTLIEHCVASHGEIHLLINCAGVLIQGDAHTFTDADWSHVLSINLHGAISATMAVYRVMMAQGFGHIVNLASLSGLSEPPFFLPYVTSKSALIGMSIALRAEAKPHGVIVSVVCPGDVATPMMAALSQQPSRLTPTITAQHAAKEILHGIRRNRPVIVFPAYARAFWLIERTAPWLGERLRDWIVARSHLARTSR